MAGMANRKLMMPKPSEALSAEMSLKPESWKTEEL